MNLSGRLYFLIGLTCISFANSALAQSTFGTISGVVTDPSGASVRDAAVEATNNNTSATRSVTTNDEGFYTFVNLDPGSYKISVRASGFSVAEQKEVVLPARESRRVDVALRLADARTTTIEVTAASVVTEQLTASDSKSGDTINSLALNFRATSNPSPIAVAPLAPGVNSDRGGNYTISGGLPNSTSFSLDGISTQLPRVGGPTKDLFPSVESISEFRVNSAANSAEFSQATDLTVITKSGTNDFHGGGFWYFQRKDLNSADQISGVVPQGDANTFGMSLGGPVTIPHVYSGKNRSFFFFDYEGVRLDNNTNISTFTPPTQWRTGDLSGAGGPVIPASQINPVSLKAVAAFYPNPTSSSPVLTAPNLVQVFPGSNMIDGFDGRFDQRFSANHRAFFRVTQKALNNVGTDSATGDTNYNPLMGAFTIGTDVLNLAGNYNWVIRPNLINEFRAGFSKANFGFSYPQAAQGDSIISSLGITGLPGSPKNGLGGVPVFYLGSFLGGQSNPYGHPRVQNNSTVTVGDGVTWVAGRHTLKFGGEFRRLFYQDNITFLNGDEYGDYFFTGANDVAAFTQFLLGIVPDAYQAQNGPDGKPYGFHYGFFGMDDFRIRRNLTISYGLRYEINTPFNDQTNQLGNFDRSYPGGRLVVQGSQGLALVNPLWKAAVGNTPFVTNSQVGLPDTLRNTYKSNIQPRLGFSYSPGERNKTVIRGSAGIYSVPVLGAVLYSLLGVDTSYFAEYPSSATNIRTFPNVFAGNGASVSYPSYRRANDYNLKDPRVIQWNFSIDRDLGWSTVGRLSYTGSHTTNLIYSPDLNQVSPNTVGYAALTATPALRQQNLKYPNFSEVLTRDNGPSSKYQALTLELNKRFSQGLIFLNNYTWAKNISNALGTAPNSAVPVGGQVDNGGNVQNRFNIAMDSGNAYYTPRHRFVSTFVYTLPLGRGQKYMGNVGRGANLLVGGWGVTGATVLQTGPWLTPFFPTSVSDPSGTNPRQRSVGQQRPDCIAGQSGYLANPTNTQYFNRSAFSIPSANIGRYGNCGVGILEGPGTTTFSMSVGKTFQVLERLGFRYEAQFANLFNLLNKDVPNMNLSSSFGRITQSQQQQQAGPRSIQMMLRLTF